MKFLSQSALFLALAASASANRSFIPPSRPYIENNTKIAMCARMLRGSNGYSELKPCQGKAKEGNDRKLAAYREANKGRRLQEATGPSSPVTGTIVMVTDGPSVPLTANVGAATQAIFKVTTIHGEVLSLTADEGVEIHAGVATVKLVNMEDTADVDDVYTWVVEVDGVQVGERYSFDYRAGDRRRLDAPAMISEGEYPFGGQSQEATGRIYYTVDIFYEDDQSWYATDFACSGTAIKDNKTGRSVILTAAHCVLEDEYTLTFGYDAIFIPNRDATTSQLDSDDIHRECKDDPCGCWTLSGGVIHENWATLPWPESLAYDYGFWVVKDTGAHSESVCNDSTALDIAVAASEFVVDLEVFGEQGTGQGYSLEHNPDFRYCSDTITEITPDADIDMSTLWMDTCGLSGGASGGPWSIGFDTTTGSGSIISVNSWSFTNGLGMGAPIIDPSEARCLMNYAREVDMDELEALPLSEQGAYVNCDRPCLNPDGTPARKLRGADDRRLGCKDEEQK